MALPLWLARFVARPMVSRMALALATSVDRPLMRVSGGRLRLSFIIPVLLLRCRGARTGALREVPLLYVPDGEDVLLVASNGGRQQEPAWAHNLRAQPGVHALTTRGEHEYHARELEGSERAAGWSRALDMYPGYGIYASRLTRTIAVFRLRRLDNAAPTSTDGTGL